MASTETESSVQPSSLEVEHGDNEELFRTGNEPARRSEMFRGKGKRARAEGHEKIERHELTPFSAFQARSSSST